MQKKKNTRFYLFAGVMIVFAIILFKIGFTRLGQQDEKLSVCTKRITAVFMGYEEVKNEQVQAKALPTSTHATNINTSADCIGSQATTLSQA